MRGAHSWRVDRSDRRVAFGPEENVYDARAAFEAVRRRLPFAAARG
jgi:hypothetical protein